MEACQELEYDVTVQEERLASLEMQIKWTRDRATTVRSLNPINDCAYVWHSGSCGTINGFRVGREASDRVNWHEVNAALGQLVLFLSLAQTPDGAVDVLPMGSWSKITKPGDRRTSYPLHADDSFSLMPKRSFNAGLTALVKFLQDLHVVINKNDPTIQLPYDLTNGKVNGTSIVYASAENAWTLVMKMLLIDVKWIAVWLAKQLRSEIIFRPPLPPSSSSSASRGGGGGGGTA